MGAGPRGGAGTAEGGAAGRGGPRGGAGRGRGGPRAGRCPGAGRAAGLGGAGTAKAGGAERGGAGRGAALGRAGPRGRGLALLLHEVDGEASVGAPAVQPPRVYSTASSCLSSRALR